MDPRDIQEPSSEHRDAITVVGARTHNLKNITVEIPLNSLTVVTGVSGSGKSTLAFDTLYAEGQRRYVASLSPYARQFLERVERPEVADIIGICPALAIRQKSYSRNPRSTVGTVTEINDYLRLLYSRIGTTLCHHCGRIVERDTPERIADFVMALPYGMRLYVCIPFSLTGKEEGVKPGTAEAMERPRGAQARARAQSPEQRLVMILPGLQRQGFVRLLINDRLVDLSEAVEAVKQSPAKEVHVVADRLVIQDGIRERLVDSLELCGRESEGRIELVILSDTPVEMARLLESSFPQIRWVPHPLGVLVKFSERFECPLCHLTYETPEPRLFSFNNPFGACPDCQGFGNTITLDFSLVIPDDSKSLAQGAIHPWTKPRYRNFHARLLLFAYREGIDVDAPWRELAEEQRSVIIHGKGDFPGIVGFFERLENKKYKMHVRIFMSRYRGYTICPACHGERLRQEARDVVIAGKRISQVLQMTVAGALAFFNDLQLTQQQAAVSEKILDEIRHRLDLLDRVGLSYLTLDRLSSTLSGGEAQRIQLATSLGSTLVGALYVLDEPSIGLHPRDSQRLVQILNSLKSMGNTVLVVEHDAEIMLSSDHIVDLGPGAGENGGRVVYQGSLEGIRGTADSLTGRYLRGELKIPTPLFRRRCNGRYVEIRNARRHNLKNLDVRIPLGVLVCITGVSGSGKSTLVHEVLHNALKRAKDRSTERDDGYDGLRGADNVTDVVLVDQSPIGRTPRSNPVTYIKAFDLVREIFANTRDAYARNLKSSHFSFNLPGGRCETCQGSGTITIEMQFLADVELVCEDCKGRRFKSSILEVRYKGRNIAEVLELTAREAIEFFSGNTRLIRKLRILEDVGLGYLRLGQSATSLSGGEAQRIKLASYLAGRSAGNILYIFDEPTTGLHFDDIRKLLTAFDKLVNAGNSMVVIEHNLDVIKTADWVIDLGPEGGDDGGYLVFEGSPDDLVACRGSYTGRFLKAHLARTSSRR
jgi:excinuclease ABC subunit A